MDVRIYPKKLSGNITVIPSKSQAHRFLICAAFADGPTRLYCPETNQDIEATAGCLRSLGATITRTADGYNVEPTKNIPAQATLNCYESGSTLRFMLPVAGALGVDAFFEMSGRLPQRPLSPLWEEMERMGCILSRPAPNCIRLQGKLLPGRYSIQGDVSSQFITGLLFAMALMDGHSKLHITGKLESRPYIDMTQQALNTFGINTDNFEVCDSAHLQTPGTLNVEGDWSNGAFFLAAKTLGNDLDILGLNPCSAQGDRACAEILVQLSKKHTVVDAADIPDLVPILAVVAGATHGAVFQNVARLRLKESDRVATVASILQNLGCDVHADENTLTVSPGCYKACTIDAFGDHRIAMAAAIAATVANGPVTILGAHCVAKSYPSFWDEYKRLGGCYEQHIR